MDYKKTNQDFASFKKRIQNLKTKVRYAEEIIQSYRGKWLAIAKILKTVEARVTEEVTREMKKKAAARLQLERDAHQIIVNL